MKIVWRLVFYFIFRWLVHVETFSDPGVIISLYLGPFNKINKESYASINVEAGAFPPYRKKTKGIPVARFLYFPSKLSTLVQPVGRHSFVS
jgi:hypothetical protein